MNSTFSVMDREIANGNDIPSTKPTDELPDTNPNVIKLINNNIIELTSDGSQRFVEEISSTQDLESQVITKSVKENPVDCQTSCSKPNDALQFNLKLRSESAKNIQSDLKDECINKGRYIIVKPKRMMNREEKPNCSTEFKEPFSRKELGFLCFKCGAIASKEKTAKRHRAAHVSGFKCSICPQVFFMKHTADIHQHLHRGGDLRHVDDFSQCKLCGGSFISLLYLEFHMYESHGEDILKNPKIVHLGPSGFDSSEVKIEEKESRKRFRCGSCDALFMYSLNLECHMAFHSENIYSCGLCDSSFSLLDFLLTHVRIHGDKHSHALLEHDVSRFNKALSGRNKAIFGQSVPGQSQEAEYATSNENADGGDQLRDEETGEGQQSTKENLIPSEKRKKRFEITRNDKGADNPSYCFNIKRHNRKFVTPSTVSHCSLGEISFSLDSQTDFDSNVGSTPEKYVPQNPSSGHTKEPFINPYIFHFLPGGKHANYLNDN